MTAQIHQDFAKYRCWVFDCDGVLLDSNAVKTQAFYDVALPFGTAAADALVAFHVEHGGISRFVKFQHLFTGILQRAPEAGELDTVIDQFSKAAKARMLECAEAPRLHDVLEAVAATGPVYVVSGSMQSELREVFAQRGLDKHFTAIFGSPDTKDMIVQRERANDAMPGPALFIGDARYDFEVADRFGLDFAFAHAWSEFSGWQTYFQDKPVPIIQSIQDLLAP